MKFRMDNTLRFWVDAAYEHIKREHRELTKHQLVAQILRKYERRGDAMRCLITRAKSVGKRPLSSWPCWPMQNVMLRIIWTIFKASGDSDQKFYQKE
jgi:hypothetical protein